MTFAEDFLEHSFAQLRTGAGVLMLMSRRRVQAERRDCSASVTRNDRFGLT